MTEKAKRSGAYTAEENQLIAAAYTRLAVAQYTEVRLIKSHLVAQLVSATGRSRGSIESKFMNYSAAAVAHNLLPGLPFGYVKGYKPASHGQKGLQDFLRVELQRAVDADTEDSDATIALVIGGQS